MEVTNASANAIFGLINGTHQYSEKEFHTILISEDVWFRANEIAQILGYVNYAKAVANNVDVEDQLLLKDLLGSTLGGQTSDFTYNELHSKYINEPGIYSLVFKSRLPAAREFERYVRREVLPNLRRQHIQQLQLKHAQEVKRLQNEAKESAERVQVLERQHLALSSYVRGFTEIEKTQVLYIASTTAYAAQNRFKFGGVKESQDLRKRLQDYNVGRAEGDLYFYVSIHHCNVYRSAEERLHIILAHFKDKEDSRKEMVRMRYTRLHEVVQYVVCNFNGEVDYMNDRSKVILKESVYEPPDVVSAIDLSVYVNTAAATARVDISGWSDEEFAAAFQEIIEGFADERKVDYTCAEDGPAELNIPWSAISASLKKMRGLSMTQWRDRFREWYARRGPARLQIRGLKLG